MSQRSQQPFPLPEIQTYAAMRLMVNASSWSSGGTFNVHRTMIAVMERASFVGRTPTWVDIAVPTPL